MSGRVVISTRPTVRRPYSAGSAPVDQGDAADPAGVENAAEAGQAVGQHHAIDAKLHVGVIVAHVKEPACGGILRHPRGLQQDFLHRLVVAAGKRLDGRLGDGGGRCGRLPYWREFLACAREAEPSDALRQQTDPLEPAGRRFANFFFEQFFFEIFRAFTLMAPNPRARAREGRGCCRRRHFFLLNSF